MQNEIRISHDGIDYETNSFVFSGGEMQVQIPNLPNILTGDITVLARLQLADALIRLLLVTEIIQRHHRSGSKTLIIPYFPYARQDRVMQSNEAFSLKAVARVINGLGYDEVVVCDPHSDVTAALVENVRIIPQVELIAAHAGVMGLNYPTIVAPDAGAAKKALTVTQRFGLPFITASKVRDTTTGAITRTELHTPSPLANADVLIVDDICDGGRTFVELAKVLRASGAGRVYLYVTHGIFSQGFDVFDGLIDGIFTTDTFISERTPDYLSIPLHISPVHF